VWTVRGLEVIASADGVYLKGEFGALRNVQPLVQLLYVAEKVHQDLARGVGAAAVRRWLG
jgi:hypothetical protein